MDVYILLRVVALDNTPPLVVVEIFDLDGNYKETIETENKFTFFCIDEGNKRVIAYFSDRKEPLGYFNVNLD